MPTKAVSVGVAEAKLVDADLSRTALAIVNNHASAILYISDVKGVSTGNGFAIQPKTTIALSTEEGYDVGKAFYGISDTALTDIRILEQYLQTISKPEPKPDIQQPYRPDPGM